MAKMASKHQACRSTIIACIEIYTIVAKFKKCSQKDLENTEICGLKNFVWSIGDSLTKSD